MYGDPRIFMLENPRSNSVPNVLELNCESTDKERTRTQPRLPPLDDASRRGDGAARWQASLATPRHAPLSTSVLLHTIPFLDFTLFDVSLC